MGLNLYGGCVGHGKTLRKIAPVVAIVSCEVQRGGVMRRGIGWGLLVISLGMCLTQVLERKRPPQNSTRITIFPRKEIQVEGKSFGDAPNPDTNEVLDIKIVKAVNKNLAAKGFVEVADKPDFYILLRWGEGTQNLAAGGASKAGDGPATSADVAPGYGLGNGPTLAPQQWLAVDGQIEFYIVVRTTQKPSLGVYVQENISRPQ